MVRVAVFDGVLVREGVRVRDAVRLIVGVDDAVGVRVIVLVKVLVNEDVGVSVIGNGVSLVLCVRLSCCRGANAKICIGINESANTRQSITNTLITTMTIMIRCARDRLMNTSEE